VPFCAKNAGVHAYQMLEAGVRQFTEWDNTDAGRQILVAVARYLAAHSPTERALQTADIARRLMRGGELHQERDRAASLVLRRPNASGVTPNRRSLRGELVIACLRSLRLLGAAVIMRRRGQLQHTCGLAGN
jgi:hypothetical protein